MAQTIRIGMIGTDTSHCGVFARIFHNPHAPPELQGFRIVAAYPSFSPDISASAGRVEGYRQMLARDHGVKIVESLEALADEVDAILLTSLDGRRHLPELKVIAPWGKPTFVDKPFAASLADAKAMAALIREHRLPCFGGSALRFDSAITGFLAEMRAQREVAQTRPAGTRPGDKEPVPLGEILGCDAYSPAYLEPTNPGLFWYGVHGVEILYALMGVGCRAVQCMSTPDVDLVVGQWPEGRIGTMRGVRKGGGGYGAVALHSGGHACLPAKGDFYEGLSRVIAEFFRTRHPPVPVEETLEICAFMDAAWRSAGAGGEATTLDV